VGGVGLAVVPDVPIGLGIGARTRRLDEPAVLVGGVVEHHVEQHADVALFCFGDEAVEVRERAVLRVDSFVVGDVVAEVDLRRRVHGRDPDRVDAEMLEVIQALGDAVEVADAVVVGVLETARINFVDDGVVVPGGVGGGSSSSRELRGRLRVRGCGEQSRAE